MFLPVFRDFVIDLTGIFVEDLLRVTIGADRTVDGLPDVELFAGARVGAKGELILIDGLRRSERAAEGIATGGLGPLRMRAPKGKTATPAPRPQRRKPANKMSSPGPKSTPLNSSHL